MKSDACRWVDRLLRYVVMAGLVMGFMAWRSAPLGAADGPALGAEACLVIDSDVGLDDFRALAVVLPQRALRAVVITEGIASVSGGSTAMALFLASAPSSAPVIPGRAATNPPVYDWLPAVRAGAERINGFLAQAVPFAGQANDMTRALEQATRGCGHIDVLVLGPWSSFVQYASVLGPQLEWVVASGRPLAENNPDNFNCVYDQPACEAADSLLSTHHGVVWVDLPSDTNPSPSYAPTEAMVAALAQTGLPGLLRAALRLDPTQWLGTRLWDDSAALYLLDPQSFTVHGAHLEPAINEETLRQRLVNAINATPAH